LKENYSSNGKIRDAKSGFKSSSREPFSVFNVNQEDKVGEDREFAVEQLDLGVDA
jgi:hypothetical protein